MIKPQWQQLVNREANKDYFQSLTSEITKQRSSEIAIYPAEKYVFNAFNYADIADVKVVILGQDPYHGKDQAHGLAFSVQSGIKVPPSLVNIYKELSTDIKDFNTPKHGCLTQWAEQGVLLLNTVLTVQQANAHSHAKLGWETFTEQVITELNENNDGCVFILWGAHAHKKGKNINQDKHLVLAGPHPSPLSAYRGFFGCQHFSQANTWLANYDIQPINWHLPIEI
ncbi:uracil-DNA glycosylase [Colwellia psychrerythraea]|uniref:Uracil-DNA glycosylase n=1 Tax=Colwellia psychrerythraea TaxID=28229 RepID=A0A099KIQ2_COLPS|nr:uracil-DNA glycosylase [Colwellia psychrerythraea]KGJ90679.1 Uracil-DNA glycosylase [Colwellia psychrerythraea]